MSSENLIDTVTDPQLQEIVRWLEANYTGIAEACETRGLPKPPPWRDLPLP